MCSDTAEKCGIGYWQVRNTMHQSDTLLVLKKINLFHLDKTAIFKEINSSNSSLHSMLGYAAIMEVLWLPLAEKQKSLEQPKCVCKVPFYALRKN